MLPKCVRGIAAFDSLLHGDAANVLEMQTPRRPTASNKVDSNAIALIRGSWIRNRKPSNIMQSIMDRLSCKPPSGIVLSQ